MDALKRVYVLFQKGGTFQTSFNMNQNVSRVLKLLLPERLCPLSRIPELIPTAEKTFQMI